MPQSSYEYNGVIEEYRSGLTDLTALVDAKKVSKQKGQYNFAKRGDYTGFTKIAAENIASETVTETDEETGVATEKTVYSVVGSAGSVDFSANSVKYEVSRYTGVCAMSEDMEADDKGLKAAIEKFLTYEDIVTKNRVILDKLQETSAGAYANYAAVKAAFEGLGVKHLAFAAVLTNESGLKAMAAAQDGTGASVVKSGSNGKPEIIVDGYTLPVIVFENDFLPDKENGAPVIAADLKEAVALLSYGKLKVVRTISAIINGKSIFDSDLVGYQAATMFDVKVKDSAAFVGGCIAV